MIDLFLAYSTLFVGILGIVSGISLFVVDIIRERKNTGYKTTEFMNTGVLFAGVLFTMFGIELVYEAIKFVT